MNLLFEEDTSTFHWEVPPLYVYKKNEVRLWQVTFSERQVSLVIFFSIFLLERKLDQNIDVRSGHVQKRV